MSIFRRKYKRSDWFEGLLECEELFNQGFVPDYNNFLSSEIGLMKSGSYVSIPKTKGEYYDGVLDYIKNLHHCENNLKGA